MVSPLKATVGLEIHVRLATGRKLFCACPVRFQAPPNTLVCPVCLGLPGSLPVPDHGAVRLALRAGAALGARLNPVSEFARKHYFYPDLPRNFQITQYDHPLFRWGELDTRATGGCRVRLQRLHLEEDAGRSVDPAGGEHTLVDANRAGAPLLEIVTEPDLGDGRQSRRWLQSLLLVLQHCGVCEGNMAEGDLRCDANVGLVGHGPGALTEIKNLNSFRHVAQAVDREIQRLQGMVEKGETPAVTTRGWDAARRDTVFQRSKEETRDYRYFPEPDIPPLQVAEDWWQAAREGVPELPHARQLRLQQSWGLTSQEAWALSRSLDWAGYWEEVARSLDDRGIREAGRLAATWVLGPVSALAPKGSPASLAPEVLVELLELLAGRDITAEVARQVLGRRLEQGDPRPPRTMVRDEGWLSLRAGPELEAVIDGVLERHPAIVRDYLEGRVQVLEYLLGQVMKLTRGRAQPSMVRQMLGDKLAGLRGNF